MKPQQRTQVAVGIVVENGRVLIARRPSDVPLGGQWEFPGGKLEPGETPEAAAEREIFEELGLTVTAICRLPPIDHDYSHARITLTPILCRRVAGEPRAIQSLQFEWAAFGDLPAYDFPDANATLLGRLMEVGLQIDAEADRLSNPSRAISSAG